MSQEPASKDHILLVDDELNLLNALAEFLKKQEYDVDTATNGESAKERLAERVCEGYRLSSSCSFPECDHLCPEDRGGLGYTPEHSIEFGVATLVHDLGMLDIPFQIFAKGTFDLKDIALLRKHPGHTCDALKEHSAESCCWLADIVVQEHEREDGTGYPGGLSGKEIHKYAKIIGIADT